MKKIISLVMMFVLSVGFLMAQGVFNYQAVVVDAEGNLVVDQDVNATVTIQYSTSTYTQTINGVHTSLNGLAFLPIGNSDDPAFMAIDWRTANIKVQFTPAESGVTMPQADYERVAGVPYALQAGGDDALTTEMIADYYGRATTTMDDMEAIFDALESNENLSEDLKRAFIDTVINNRQVAKQILLHYLNTGTPEDVQALYDAYDGNENLKTAFKAIAKELITENRELVYDILRAYTVQLTSAEVNAIIDAIPDDVMERMVVRAANYLKDLEHNPNPKTTLIIPIFMDYVANITTDEFDELVQTIMDNGPVFQVMLAQFNTWMDEYFQNHFTGGSDVEDVVAAAVEDGYYAQCEGDPIDLCQLQANLESLSVCFDTEDTEFSFEKDNSDNLVYTLSYQGTDPTSVTLSVTVNDGNTAVMENAPLQGAATVNAQANTITITITPQMVELLPGYDLQAVLTITVDCLDSPFGAVGFFSEE